MFRTQVDGYKEIIYKEGYKIKNKITHRRVHKSGYNVGYGVEIDDIKFQRLRFPLLYIP